MDSRQPLIGVRPGIGLLNLALQIGNLRRSANRGFNFALKVIYSSIFGLHGTSDGVVAVAQFVRRPC